MAKTNDDEVKKIFGKSAEQLLSWKPDGHSKHHNSNAFCGNAGPEETKHYYSLVGKLTGEELVDLAVALGFIKKPTHDPSNPAVRQSLEDMLDEADREDFYREHHKILNKRGNK